MRMSRAAYIHPGSLGQAHPVNVLLPDITPPTIPYTIPDMVPASAWVAWSQPVSTPTGRPDESKDLSRQFLEFSEQNMIWIVGGTLGFVLLMSLMGGKR